MKLTHRTGAAIAALGVLLSAATAEAATITRTYLVTLGDFINVAGATPPPVATLSGEFTLTFDDSANFSNQTTGISVSDYFGPAQGSTLAFSSFALGGGAHRMSIGGLQTGSSTIAIGSADFVLQIDFADASFDNPFLPACSAGGFNCGSGGPSVLPSGYTVAGQSGGWLAQTGRISVAVPEPSTWAMMLMGFGGLGATLRTRRRLAAIAA